MSKIVAAIFGFISLVIFSFIAIFMTDIFDSVTGSLSVEAKFLIGLLIPFVAVILFLRIGEDLAW